MDPLLHNITSASTALSPTKMQHIHHLSTSSAILARLISLALHFPLNHWTLSTIARIRKENGQVMLTVPLSMPWITASTATKLILSATFPWFSSQTSQKITTRQLHTYMNAKAALIRLDTSTEKVKTISYLSFCQIFLSQLSLLYF